MKMASVKVTTFHDKKNNQKKKFRIKNKTTKPSPQTPQTPQNPTSINWIHGMGKTDICTVGIHGELQCGIICHLTLVTVQVPTMQGTCILQVETWGCKKPVTNMSHNTNATQTAKKQN